MIHSAKFGGIGRSRRRPRFAATSPFLPPSAYSNLELWLDGSTLSGSDGSTVTTWPDLSGNARDAAANGGGYSAGTLLAAGMNGKNAVRFNGTNQVMASNWRPTTAPVTMGVVFKLNSTVGGNTKGVFTQDVSGIGGFSIEVDQLASGVGVLSMEFKASPYFRRCHFPIKNAGETICVIIRATISGTTVTQSLWVNGMQGDEFTYTTANGTPASTKLGGYAASNLQCPVDIGEAFGYSRGLTDAEIVALSGYAVQKWGCRSTFNTLAYVQPSFHNSEEKLYLSESADGQTWYPLPIKHTPSVGTVRDPSMIVKDGYQWVCYTSCGFSTGMSFGVAKAPVGSGVFTMVANVTCQVGATTQVWGPKWFIDENGNPNVIVNVSEGSVNAGPFKLYRIAPTNAAMTTWGSLELITGTGLPSTLIDASVFRRPGDSSNWWILVKNEATLRACLLQRSGAAFGVDNWTVAVSDLGWGQYVEGFSIMFESSAPHKVLCDQYSASSPDGAVYMSYGTVDADLALIGANPAAGWTPLTHAGGLVVRNGQARRRDQLSTV